ncbi:MAG TPA: helix-turn-helix domain-containing protein, partial [Ktedonobacterales bacterium]
MVGDVDQAGMAFGDLLRSRRRAAGLTQEELAERAGLSARGIADLERGVRRAPRRETVLLLAHALGAAPEEEAAFFAAARRPTAPPKPSAPALHNLPAHVTALLGRDEAIREVVALARRPGTRLVTLTGPGGIGKTRLALGAAAELLPDFSDGVWFVRLSRLTDPALVILTIAEALGVREAGSEPVGETLRARLSGGHTLLTLDNFEQVAGAAPDVAELLEACPALCVLTTSRAPLRLQGERVYPVAPLGAPPAAKPNQRRDWTPDELAEYPAVALFVERAQAAKPDFALTAANTAAVAEICARLDGLPLAIELAAARVKLLPPVALLAHLERGLGLLAGGARDLPERQQAMRDTIAWSERLLSADEQLLFRRLAIFAGGCALDAAEAVCAAPEGLAPLGGALLDRLEALVDQNLAQQREEGDEARFGMLRVIREYALARLVESGEAEAARRAHAGWALALAERVDPELIGPDATIWLERLEREHDNLRAALDWARTQGELAIGLRLVVALLRYWMMRGHLGEGRTWAEGLLADAEARGQPAPPMAFFAAGVLALYQRDEAAATRWLERAAARGRELGDLNVTARAQSSLGIARMQQGDLGRARASLEESLDLMRSLGDKRGIAIALGNLGVVIYTQGDM